MPPTARLRYELARHPWIRWGIVVALAAAVGVLVRGELAALATQREAWGRSRDVLVADGDLAPGDVVRARTVTLPDTARPAAALESLPEGAVARQHVADGEVLVEVDVFDATGPAAGAPAGTVVVGIVDPLMRASSVGDRVLVAADGAVLADEAVIVHIVDEVAYVAVDPTDAAATAAASRDGTATLLYVP